MLKLRGGWDYSFTIVDFKATVADAVFSSPDLVNESRHRFEPEPQLVKDVELMEEP